MEKKKTSIWRRVNPTVFYHTSLSLLFTAVAVSGLICYGLFRRGWLVGTGNMPFYKIYLLIFLPVFGLFYGVRKLTIFLEQRCTWLDNWRRRLVYQLSFGGLVPLGIVWLLYLFFLPMLPDRMHLPDFRDMVLLLADALLLLANLIDGLIYFVSLSLGLLALLEQMRNRRGRNKEKIKSLQTHSRILERQLEEERRALALKDKELKVYRQWLETMGKKTPAHYILRGAVPKKYKLTEIACFFKIGKLVFLQLFNDPVAVPANENSLVKVMQKTGDVFRKVTRDYLVAKHSIASYSQKENGKLLIELKVPEGTVLELSDDISRALRTWIVDAVEMETGKSLD